MNIVNEFPVIRLPFDNIRGVHGLIHLVLS